VASNPAVALRVSATAAAVVPHTLRRAMPLALVSSAALVWAAAFGWLAVTRHLAGGSHAEDLGWTDQVLNNFLRGQWFRMSIYQGAFWNTELNIDAIRRPDSLLAFHVEPMLLLLVPLYALGGTVTSLLVLQALGFAAGAIPAYRIGLHLTHSRGVGLALALAYLLSPLGQWAVLSDFHSSTLAAPLLLLTMDLLLARHATWQVLCVAALAVSAREDVGPTMAVLGVLPLFGLRMPRQRTLGLVLLTGGIGWTVVCGLVIRAYSGGTSPFDVRYASLREVGPIALLLRPMVIGYASTLLLGGGWLALFAPTALVPAFPTFVLNVLSSSDWMASGKAHYSALIVPLLVFAAASSLGRLATHEYLLRGAAVGLVISSVAAYAAAGAGPLAANFAPATVTAHAARAAALADSIPSDASVSATSSLVPRLTRRAHVYVFPAVLDADYIFLDLLAGPAPTSAGDVFLRVQSLLANGGWQIQTAEDGLLVLQRKPDAPPSSITTLVPMLFPQVAGPLAPSDSGPASAMTLLDARLVPAPDAAIDVDGPRWMLHTTWRTPHIPPPPGTRLHFWLDLGTAEPRDAWDIAELWWNPPDAWAPDATISIDVPDVPRAQFRSWQAALV
jgi:uncharacterized membrane protein